MNEQQRKRYDEILEQLRTLSGELWDLVQPTPGEIGEVAAMYEGEDAAEWMVTEDKKAWAIAINTALDVQEHRDDEQEYEEKENQ